jgi:hypothetical protein
MEALREVQRKRADESKAEQLDAEKNGHNVDSSKAQQTSVGTRASAYIGSWTTWAGQKRKEGWGRSSTSNGSSGGGWGFGGVRKSRNITSNMFSDSGSEKNGTPLSSPTPSTSGFTNIEQAPTNNTSHRESEGNDKDRPLTQHSFSESVLDGAVSDDDSGSSNPTSPRKPMVSKQDDTAATGSKEGHESSEEMRQA